jgi:hypothetical protein
MNCYHKQVRPCLPAVLKTDLADQPFNQSPPLDESSRRESKDDTYLH